MMRDVYNMPKRKLWYRMDDVFDANTQLRGSQTIPRYLKVRDYCLEQLADMENFPDFDRADRLDYLTWAIEWYVYHVPGRHSPERQVCLI
jgi:hypothetical protein